MLGNGVTGCTPNVEPTPTPAVTPTVTPTSTPQWTTEEQAAIAAVQRYLEVWTEISQNLDDTSQGFDKIWEVATAEHATNKTVMWIDWRHSGQHLVGAPTFEVTSVAPGYSDNSGHRYHVYGCYSTEGSYLVDSDGNEVQKFTGDRLLSSYMVLRTNDDLYLVGANEAEPKPC